MKSIVVAMLLLVAAATARAEDQPWSAGVSAEQKASAQVLLDAGNALFVENRYADALAQYMKAIAVWDHPSIRFNIVRCLIQLDRPIEAAENLERALRYGRGPLKEDLYAEALSYQKLLAKQVADVEIRCDQPGVKLTFDARTLGTCPMQHHERVLPGPHQIVGSKAGYVTRSEERILVGGSHETMSLSLVPLARAGQVTHRWATWVPWTVFGAGVGFVGIGALVDAKGASDMRAYERLVARDCPTFACPAGTVDPSLHDGAILENRLGLVMMATGIAAAATGGVMLYMNRAHVVYPTEIEVTPHAGGATVGVRAAF